MAGQSITAVLVGFSEAQNRCHPYRDWLDMPIIHSVGSAIDTLDRMEDGTIGGFACCCPGGVEFGGDRIPGNRTQEGG